MSHKVTVGGACYSAGFRQEVEVPATGRVNFVLEFVLGVGESMFQGEGKYTGCHMVRQTRSLYVTRCKVQPSPQVPYMYSLSVSILVRSIRSSHNITFGVESAQEERLYGDRRGVCPAVRFMPVYYSAYVGSRCCRVTDNPHIARSTGNMSTHDSCRTYVASTHGDGYAMQMTIYRGGKGSRALKCSESYSIITLRIRIPMRGLSLSSRSGHPIPSYSEIAYGRPGDVIDNLTFHDDDELVGTGLKL